MKRCVESFVICCGCPLFYYRMMKINMSIMEMLCMQPVCVGPKSVKDTCSSKALYVGVLQYTTDNILIAKSVDPKVASLKGFLQFVEP
jgi:nitrate reductase beta subunit